MSAVIDFSELKEIHEQKKAVVMQFLNEFYQDMQVGLDIPYFLKAEQTYKEIIKNNSDLDIFYRKILKKRAINE